MKTLVISIAMMVSSAAYAERKATEWDKKLIPIANREGVPALLLAAICFVESSHRPHMTNFDDGGSSSIGLCQIKLSTAQQMGYDGKIEGLYDGRTNAKYAAKYIKWQLNRYDNDWNKAAAAYNAGSVFMKDGQFKNKVYVDRVNDSMRK